MGTTTVSALDKMLDPMARCLTSEVAQRIVEFRIDPDVESRVESLAEKANDGLLSDEERIEYQGYVDAADFIAIFKSKARRMLSASRGV